MCPIEDDVMKHLRRMSRFRKKRRYRLRQDLCDFAPGTEVPQMRLIAMTLSVLALTAVVSTQRRAPDEIVIPQPVEGVGLCVPFGCSTRIQQVFDASAFPSMFRIDALDLFNNFDQSAEGF